MTSTQNRIAIRILKTLESNGGTAEWKTIVETLKSEFTIKNWLTEARGPLQFLINNGLIERTGEGMDRVAKELYAITADGREFI